MHIAVCFRQDVRNEQPVPCYARSYAEAFEAMGHMVTLAGEGHDHPHLQALHALRPDLIVEIENGRNAEGQLRFQVPEIDWHDIPPTVVVLIDSHGHPDLHQAVARSYAHVFFAVWARRELYANHPSAHWCPNATDLRWFHPNTKTELDGMLRWERITPSIDYGFFGSKMGLERADDLVEICKRREWTYDVREVVKARRHRWPATAEAMAACRYLYNRGQKHDGPNQRVMESMAMLRPLITDLDERDGMAKLFKNGEHFVGYHAGIPGSLEEAMEYVRDPQFAQGMVIAAFKEVSEKHQVLHRAQQILEVVK